LENQPKAVRDFVSMKVKSIFNNSKKESYARASLAKLRRGIGKNPGSLPDIWEHTLEGLPEEFLSKTGEPTYAEWATYLAITLFALHQQGKDWDKKPMSVSGQKIGEAVRKYAPKDDPSEEAVKRRFDAAVTSDSPEELAHHLRVIVQLLKSKDIPLDYPQLAEDLFRFQFPESRDGVRLSWGQSYYLIRKDTDKNEG